MYKRYEVQVQVQIRGTSTGTGTRYRYRYRYKCEVRMRYRYEVQVQVRGTGTRYKCTGFLRVTAGSKRFSAKYTVLLNKWRTRLSTALNREVANCIIEGARNARGGERLDSNSVAAGSLHLFEYTAEAVRLVSTFNLR